MRYLVLTFALLASSAQAVDFGGMRLNFSIASEHSRDYRTRYRTESASLSILESATVSVPYKEYFDGSNPGIGGEIPVGERAYFLAGGYDNSLPGSAVSIYAGIGYDLLSSNKFALCVEAVAASGYDDGLIGGDVCARLKLSEKNWIKFHYAPGESFDIGTDVYAIEYQIPLT